MNKLQRIPNWLRWILILPCSFLAFVLAFVLSQVVCGFGMHRFAPTFMYGFLTLFYIPFASAFAVAAFVYVGKEIAPKMQFRVAVCLVCILGFLIAGSLIVKILVPSQANVSWMELVLTVVGGVLGVFWAFKDGEIVSEKHK